MPIGRREWMALAAGAAAGTAFSPVPWKLLDDLAIWTQNWPWIPRPATGATTERFGICTMCRAGCGLKARCAGQAVTGIAPVSGRALCPFVFGAHQLPYHPLRLRGGLAGGRTVAPKEALAAAVRVLARACAAGDAVAILDERPGRILSSMYAQVMRESGNVVTISQVEDRTLCAIEALAGLDPGSLGFDFERAGVILSIGAPLLEGWGAAGRMERLWSARHGEAPLFLHVGSRWSRTAQLADRTFLLRPGSEGAIAAALAGKCGFEQAGGITGLSPQSLAELHQLLRARGPAIVVGGGEAASAGLPESTEQMIAALNLELGSVGRPGGIVPRRQEPAGAPLPQLLEHIEDASLQVLIHDASSGGVFAPESLLRRKLAPGGTLVRLTAFQPDRVESHDILIPSTTFLESPDDAAGPREAIGASWTCSAALISPPSGAISAQEFATACADGLRVQGDTWESLRDAKAAAIVAARRGRLRLFADESESPVEDAKSLLKAMDAGAEWVDDPAPARPIREVMNAFDWRIEPPAPAGLVAIAAGTRGNISALPAVPLASKLDRETRLLPVPGEVRIHPETAQACGVRSGESIAVQTEFGEMRGIARVEPAAVRGQVELCAAGALRQDALNTAGAAAPSPAAAVPARIRRS